MENYKSTYTGSQIDTAIGRALPGGEIDQSTSAKLDWEGLINPEFTVAQAGIGGNHGSVPYAADCWKLVSGTVSAAPGGGLVLNGTIRQTRETAVGFDAVASINATSGTATYDDATKQFDITSSGGTIKRAHLGLREITDWAKMPKADYGEMLQKCMRYYFRKHFGQHETVAQGYLGPEWLTLALGIGTQMRTNYPAVTMIGTLALVGASPTANITSLTSCMCSGAIANVGTSAIASTQGACYAFPPDSGGATIEIINDL
jgi:hypothetical protein